MTLVTYILAAMMFWLPPRSSQRSEYQDIAIAISLASSDPEDAIQLAAIGSLESGYAIHAVSRDGLGCIGVWQICPFPGWPVPKTLAGQAKEALRRWKEQGRCGYTGETNRVDQKCPLADERYLRARLYSHKHPYSYPQY